MTAFDDEAEVGMRDPLARKRSLGTSILKAEMLNLPKFKRSVAADQKLIRVFHCPAENFIRDVEVITMDMIGKVRRMKLRDQLSDGEICRRTGLARNTVKKWLKAPGDITPKYLRKKADCCESGLSTYQRPSTPSTRS